MVAVEAFELDLVEGRGNRSLDQSARFVLPLLPDGLLEHAVAQLKPGDVGLAIRHKILAVSGPETQTNYAVATEQAFHEARRRGLNVVARINPADFRSAIFRRLGQRLLQRAVYQLARDQPSASARQRLTRWQLAVLLLAPIIGFGALHVVLPGRAGLATSLMCGAVFATVIAFRILCLLPDMVRHQTRAPALADAELPVYSVLVPLFRETRVLNQLIGALASLSYPVEKLDIKIILEEEDQAMRRAVAELALPEHFDIIVVPAGKPQTKPRALNYALHFARGHLVTVYDSEDIPEPMQLRLAAAIFAREGDDLGCLQARLSFYNPNENWLSRQFTAEYATLFGVVLPVLAYHHLPLPLGGTSNHFRRQALASVGAWDPFNVTEDADLGLRLARMGYETKMLHSTTFEEANTHFSNWLKQRRRWFKGFLQTWLVHMRSPARLLRETGLDGFFVVQVMTIGVVASALVHPFLLGHAIWFLASGEAARRMADTVQAMAVGLNIAILTAGYAVAFAAAKQGLRRIGIRGWWTTLFTIPLYWMLMSLAAWLALWDFAVRPHHWHKTEHGLSAFMRRR